jgi:hypothetical protein
MYLTDIFRAFHSMAAEYTFLSSAHGTFTRIDYTLGHKASLNKFKKIEVIPNIFSYHNGIKPEINSRRKTRKFIIMGLLFRGKGLLCSPGQPQTYDSPATAFSCWDYRYEQPCPTTMWKVNNTLLNTQWVKEKSKEKLENIMKQIEKKIQTRGVAQVVTVPAS